MSPRGNDAEAAGTELAARTGEAPNAEEMIADNAARWSAELRAANNRPVDQAATDEMDEDEAAGLVEAEGEIVVLGFAVRGPFVVVVYEDEDGNVVKEAVQRKGHEKQAERLAPKQEEKAEEKAAKAEEKDAEKAESASGRRTAAAR
jgi:hypothetical protein